MRTSMFAVVPLLVLPTCIHAAMQEIWWNITYATANPDGLFPRRVIGVNGTWPPPPIEITSNDTLLVHAMNGLPVPTSLHHHGMFFNRTSWADGAVGVTQCGIPSGETFTYELNVQDWNQWGTYWVHSHYKGQYVDGLRAPYLIHNAAPTGEVYAEDYDDEYTIILGDWYHQEHDLLAAHFLSQANPGGAEPVPDSGLIYFTHNGTYLPPTPGTISSPSTVGFNENATLPFEPGKTYRLRIVNTSGFSMFYFWIDGHDMRIVEVDGTDTQEYSTSLISITVAQRYSILVTARNDTGSNFVIHANLDTTMYDMVPDTLNPNITSSITYNADPSTPLVDAGEIQAYFDLNDTAIVPFAVEPELPPPDHIVELNVFFDTMDNGINRAMFNNVTYNSPLVPSLLTELSMGNDSANVAVYGPQAFVLQHNEIVEIRVRNWDAGKHPFHLHGHKFQIVHKSFDVTSDDPTINPPEGIEGQANPIRRDTVEVPSLGNAYLRIAADNPGAWFFHCHIEWHLDAGLAVTFLEAPLLAQQNTQLPPYVPAHCNALSLPSTGNAAGHNSTTDLSGLTIGPFPQNLGWHQRGIGAMAGCVLAAVVGMLGVVWYAFGGQISDEEMEEEVRDVEVRKGGKGRMRRVVGRMRMGWGESDK
ncbi:multicopper oxidase [Ramaria rubella]|nr:multicopper oxidase [Ramaria rubella]